MFNLHHFCERRVSYGCPWYANECSLNSLRTLYVGGLQQAYLNDQRTTELFVWHREFPSHAFWRRHRMRKGAHEYVPRD